MTTTFTDRLASGEGRDLRKYVTIEGVRPILQDGDVDVPTALIAAARTRVQCISALEQGRRELDMVARRAKGGGLRLRLVDDDSHTLRSLFSMRKRRATYISANVAAGGTTITVKNTSAFASAGDFWVGGECISYTGKTATTFTGCTRGAYGTRARALRGGTNNGQAVYISPPSWIGRVVTLYGYFLDDEGDNPTSTDMQATLGTFELDAPPQFVGGDEWELSAVDRIDGYLKKGIYVGVVESTETFNLILDDLTGSGEAHADLTETQLLSLFGTTTTGTDLTGNNANVLLRLNSTDNDPDRWLIATATAISIEAPSAPTAEARVTLNYEPGLNLAFQPSDGEAAGFPYAFNAARPAAYLREKADAIARKVLTSRAGASANGGSDVLLGLISEQSTETDPDIQSWSMGANILAADIDLNAFIAVGSRVEWFYVLAEPTTVGDFLRDFCLCADAFVCTNAAGQLSVKSMSDSLSNDATTEIDDDDLIGAVRAHYDEANVFPNILLECDYHAGEGTFHKTIEVHDNEMGERFPHRDAQLKLQSKSLNVVGAPFWITVMQHSREEIQARLRRYQSDEGGRGALILDARVHMDHALLDIGDFVTITATDAPDMEGSTISNKRARVVSVLPDWREGTVDLRLQILRGPKLISPAAQISGVAGNVLTLQGASVVYPENDGSPAEMFGIGNTILIWNAATSLTFSTTIVDTPSASTIEVAALPNPAFFVIDVNLDFVTFDVASVNDTNPTQNGYTPASDFIFQVDGDEADYEADLSANGESRWR